jgi:hypothetical protein
VYRRVPFCSCYLRVGRLPEPDLCWFCVGAETSNSLVFAAQFRACRSESPVTAAHRFVGFGR